MHESLLLCWYMEHVLGGGRHSLTLSLYCYLLMGWKEH